MAVGSRPAIARPFAVRSGAIRRYVMKPMVCLEKVRLVGEYAVASSAPVMANTKLRAARETDVGISDALGMWKAANAKCVETRQALQEHKAEHGC